MPKISVIVPIYNVEKYLVRCLDSIINQTFKDIEIILVNDGSTDSSYEICKRYAKENKNVYIIDKKNEGVSKTRNEGINAAKGDYITFIDSDDWIEHNMLYDLYTKSIDDEADICIAGYYNDVENEANSSKEKIFNSDVIVSNEEVIQKFMIPTLRNFEIESRKEINRPNIFGCLYKTALIKDNNIKFVEGMKISEDRLFNVQIYKECKKIVNIKSCYYHYIHREGSATKRYINNLDEEQMKFFNYINTKFDPKEKELLEIRSNLAMYIFNGVITSIINETKKYNKIDYRKKIKKIKYLCERPITYEAIQNVDLNLLKKNKAKYLFYYFLKYKQTILLYIYTKIINIYKKS